MYCNCKDITAIWNELNQRVFKIIEQIYKEKHAAIRKRNYPMVEMIRKDAELHGNNIDKKIDLLHGKDIFYIQISGCRCKNRPLLRISEKCLELSDAELSKILTDATDKLEKGMRLSFTIALPSLQLEALK